MPVRNLMVIFAVTAIPTAAYAQNSHHNPILVGGIPLCSCGTFGGSHGNLPTIGAQPKSPVGNGELLYSPRTTGAFTNSSPAFPASPASSPPAAEPASSASVTAYSSRPQATAKLFLDFDGITFAGTWGSTGRSPGVVPRYTTDGNTSGFSANEQQQIFEIYSRVAEAYSPFNVDVTTIDPGTPSAGQSVRIVIGGSNAWYGGGGGVAYIGSFTYANYSYGTAWVFPDNLGGGNPKYVADAAIHEAGHTFGLYHQQQRSANGQLNAEYREAENDPISAPYMGVSYYRDRAVWSNGVIGFDNNQLIYQDDLAQIGSTASAPYNHPFMGSSSSNGFGRRADDFGNTTATATPLPAASGGGIFGAPTPRILSITGVIERNTDIDMFSVWIGGGDVTINVDNALFGAMLDTRLLLYSETGLLLTSVNPAISTNTPGLGLDASWTGFLDLGTYYIGVGSAGGYSDLGQYTLTVLLPFSSVPEPAAALLFLGLAPLAFRRR